MKVKSTDIRNLGLLLIIFIFFSKSFHTSLLGGYKGVIMILCFATVLLFFSFYKRKIRKINFLTIMWIAVLIVALSNNYDIKYGNTLSFVQIIVATIMLVLLQSDDEWCQKTSKTIKTITIFYLITGLILLVFPQLLIKYVLPLFKVDNITYYSESLLTQIQNGYMTGLTSHYSIMGIYLSIGLCFYSGKIFVKKDESLLKKYSMIILLMIGTILSGKRSALIFPILAIMLTYVFFFKPNNLKKRISIIIYITLFALFSSLVLSLTPNIGGSIGRIMDVIDSKDINVITNKRYKMLWEPAIQLFKEKPLLGIGWGNFKYSFSKYYTLKANQNNTHNVFLQVLCETGIIGFVVVFGCIILSIRETGKWIKITKKSPGLFSNKLEILGISYAMQLYFLLYCISGNPLYDIHIYLPYMISVSMAITTINTMKKIIKEGEISDENWNINLS